MNEIGPTMMSIKGAHIASLFKGDADRFKSAVPFVLSALDRNEKCVYILDDSTQEQVVDSLMKIRDVQNHLDAHQITFLSSSDTYLKDGRFDADRMLAMLKSLEPDAMSEGYAGVRATGEMSWYHSKMPGVEGLREYEARINDIYPDMTPDFLCQYAEEEYDSGLLLDVIRAHPRVVVRGELCVNPYFTPSGELLSSMRGVVPKGMYERATTDILKRARLTAIHGMELRDFRRASGKMAVLGGSVLQDIQSQVSVVNFYTELAMDSVKDEVTRGYLEKVAGRCSEIEKRLEFMQTFKMVDQTEFRWHHLRSMFGTISEGLSSRGIDLDLKLGNVRVWADGLFETAMQALIEDMPDLSGERNRLTVESREIRGSLLVSIEHLGKGVQEIVKDRLFEYGYGFGRSDGYGLFLAKEILRSAGIALREAGSPGKSTKFEIIVPQGKYSID